MSPLAIQSEESFLKYFCQIEEFSWGRRYFWDEGQNWGKFNFIRVLDESLENDELSKIVDSNRIWFQDRGKVLNLKLGSESKLIERLPKSMKTYGTPICYFSTPRPDFDAFRNTELIVEKAKNISDVEDFWACNSSGRAREDAFKSPLWEPIKKAYNTDCQFALLKDKANTIACGALTLQKDLANVWGIAVPPDYRSQGYMKQLWANLVNEVTTDLFCQVNLESHSYNFVANLPHSELLMTENRYVFEDQMKDL